MKLIPVVPFPVVKHVINGGSLGLVPTDADITLTVTVNGWAKYLFPVLYWLHGMRFSGAAEATWTRTG